jgi:anti-sigma B factor antagonist
LPISQQEVKVMPVPRIKKLWEKAPSGMGPVARTDGIHAIPASLWDANGRPDLRVRTVGGLTVVNFVNAEALYEEETIQELGERLRRLVDEGNVRLLVNLSSVRYASSSVVALLAWLYLRIDTAGGVLRLCGVEPVLFDMLRLCHLDRVVEVYANETVALLTIQASQE